MNFQNIYPAGMPRIPLRILRVIGIFFVLLGAGYVLLALSQQEINPRADFWRAVREGASGYTSVASVPQETLIQNGGENWRQIRNGLLAGIAPWILAAVFLVIMLFYFIKGPEKLETPRTGEKIKRYNLGERLLHWITAALFIVLAVTGLSMLFGRAVIIPLFRHSSFSGYMQWGMWTHNVCGPFFLAGVLLEFIIWVKHNIFRKIDLVWFKNLGGMVGKGPRPHSGKINGGEKAWFWVMVLSVLGIGTTGLILDFPIFGQSRFLMQVCHIIHVTLAVLLTAASFAHIYIGSIGSEGSFEGMWSGEVDASWAMQHQDLWYEEVTGKTAP